LISFRKNQALTAIYCSNRNAVAPFTKDMIPVTVTRFPEKPDPELLNIKRLPRKDGDVRKAVSIAAFLALAEIFDPTIPCLGAAQRNAAYPLLETEGLQLLLKYAFVNAGTVADAVESLLAISHKQTVAGQTTRRTITYLHSRRNDGMNSRGDLSKDGLCYSDYSLYQAVNPPQSEIGRTTVSTRSPHQSYVHFPSTREGGSHMQMDHSCIHSAQRSITWTSIKTCEFQLPTEALNYVPGLHPTWLELFHSLTKRPHCGKCWMHRPRETTPSLRNNMVRFSRFLAGWMTETRSWPNSGRTAQPATYHQDIGMIWPSKSAGCTS
jgi:hypothetical protein